MFKCTLCNQEYEVKPQYCDCGNDSFEEIYETIKDEVKEPTLKTEIPQSKIKTKKKQVRFSQGDIISYIIFFICIILSILSIIFLGNTKPENELSTESKPQAEQILNKDIPSIDKLWNDTPPKNISKSVKQTPIKTTVVKNIQQTIQQSVKKQSPKIQAIQKNNKPVQKPVVNNKPQVQPKPQTQQPVQQASKPAPVVQQQPKPVQVDNTKALQQELKNYKIALRNAIAREIDFTKVIGDGSCEIEFALNSSGKLINKNFSKQSNNSTLNDVVYYAMMSISQFNTPPQNYKGETLTLKVSIFGGRFELVLE